MRQHADVQIPSELGAKSGLGVRPFKTSRRERWRKIGSHGHQPARTLRTFAAASRRTMGFAHPWILRTEGEVVRFPTERVASHHGWCHGMEVVLLRHPLGCSGGRWSGRTFAGAKGC
jgi:hypothetical protein